MNTSKIHMVVGDDIYYEEHEFECLSYFREKPIDIAYTHCYK